MRGIAVALLFMCAVQSYGIRPFTWCRTNADCAADECCRSNAVHPFYGGMCGELKEEAQTCSPVTKPDGTIPDIYYRRCPCVSGYECKADHEVRDIEKETLPKCVAKKE